MSELPPFVRQVHCVSATHRNFHCKLERFARYAHKSASCGRAARMKRETAKSGMLEKDWACCDNIFHLRTMTTLDLTQIFHSDPEVLGGTPVFTGTRVPVKNLLDHIKAGDSIDEFLEGFPSVQREQVIAFLEAAKDRLLKSA